MNQRKLFIVIIVILIIAGLIKVSQEWSVEKRLNTNTILAG